MTPGTPRRPPPAPRAGFTRRHPVIATLLAILLAFLLIGALAWQLSRVREAVFIALVFKGPNPNIRAAAAGELVGYPNHRVIAALILFLNQVDLVKDEKVAVQALTTLCIITGQKFEPHFEGNRTQSSIGVPGPDEWPQILGRINLWAAGRAVARLVEERPAARPYTVPEKVRVERRGGTSRQPRATIPRVVPTEHIFVPACRIHQPSRPDRLPCPLQRGSSPSERRLRRRMEPPCLRQVQ